MTKVFGKLQHFDYRHGIYAKLRVRILLIFPNGLVAGRRSERN